MSLTLHYHPLASYCWKVLIPLYEIGTPFTPVLVNLGDPAERDAFYSLSPLRKMPVLVDDASGRTVAKSSIIIEYLDRHHPGRVRFIPVDPEQALEVRFVDRLFDIYVHEPMQKIVTDKLRPAGRNDGHGVEQAREQLAASYAMLEDRLADDGWSAGPDFSLADCAAAPALFYANKVQPFEATHPRLASYFVRLSARPSFARVVEEAGPWFKYFPG